MLLCHSAARSAPHGATQRRLGGGAPGPASGAGRGHGMTEIRVGCIVWPDAALACGKLTHVVHWRAAYPSEVIVSRRHEPRNQGKGAV